MTELSQETVTLVFTDIEGSTRLLTSLGSRYEAVLAEHRRLLRAAFSSHAGIEVDTQGDAFFYAFAKPTTPSARRSTPSGRFLPMTSARESSFWFAWASTRASRP